MSLMHPHHHPHSHANHSIDMLNGSIPSRIILFAIPLALTSIFQQLFNTADAIVAGRFIDSAALAGVGGVAPVISLFVTMLVGLSIGANVMIAVHIGHKDYDRIRGALQTTAVMAIVTGVLFSIISFLLTDPILDAINVPTEAWADAQTYLHVFFAGMVFLFIYNFASAALRAKGDSRRPLFALAIGAALNAILNVVATQVFGLGVFGIALATVISNAVAAALVVWFLLTEEENYRLTFKGMKVVHDDLRHLLYIGIPSGCQGAAFALSNVIVQMAINGFGTDATAGSSAALNYEVYSYFIVNAFAQAAVTFTGQNYAAGKLDRCNKIFRFCMIGSACFSFGLSIILVGFENIFLSFFTTETAALTFAVARMWHVCLIEFMTTSYEVPAAAMRGMGWSILPTIITIVGSCLLRIIYVFTVFNLVYSYENLLLIYPITWVITGTSMIVLFVIARKRSYAKANNFGQRTNKTASQAAN